MNEWINKYIFLIQKNMHIIEDMYSSYCVNELHFWYIFNTVIDLDKKYYHVINPNNIQYLRCVII